MNICITNTFSLSFWVVPNKVCLILLLVGFSHGLKCRLFVCSPLQKIIHKAAKNKTGVKAHFLADILLFSHSCYRIIHFLRLSEHFAVKNIYTSVFFFFGCGPLKIKQCLLASPRHRLHTVHLCIKYHIYVQL